MTVYSNPGKIIHYLMINLLKKCDKSINMGDLHKILNLNQTEYI